MDKPWLSSYEPVVPPTLTFPETNLYNLLADTARQFPNNTAASLILSYLLNGKVTIGGKLTYSQLVDQVERFANALYQLGVRKGDRVALMLPNSLHYVIAFHAAMRIGAIIVNNNPTYTARELKHQLIDSGAETIIILNLFYPRLREIQGDTNVKRVIVAHMFDMLGFPSKQLVKAKQKRDAAWVDVHPEHDIFFFERLVQKYPPMAPAVEVHPDDVAVLQYTGGTTGLPKAAMLTHRNLVVNATQINSWFTSAERGVEKFMCAIPFFHVYGLVVAMVYGVSIGAELQIVPNPRPIENVMKIMQKERSTVYPGVPAMYIGIVNHPNVAEYDLRSIKACLSGSAPLPVEVQIRFNELTGGRLIEGFGMTELSPVSHANPLHGVSKNGSVGIPLPNTEAKIVDLETLQDIPIGSEASGELWVRGPQVMKGYWERAEETANTVTADGWLRTGDVARTDDDGYFYIVDRLKDMIIVSGLKVLPRDVEEVLYMHPQIREAAVVGIPNKTRGDDTVTAFIVTKDGESIDVEQLKSFCKQYLAEFKVPRNFEFRTELPKTTVGKVLRRALVEEMTK
ncbi:MAG: long-chain-fatty-acid--CoA ligase [Roseiflexaceae bacterium]